MQDTGKKEDEGIERERRLIVAFHELPIGYKKVVLSILADAYEHEYHSAVMQEVLVRSTEDDLLN